MDRLVPAEGKPPLQVNDHTFKASALGGKDHAMRLEGFIGTGTDVRSIVLGNGPGKGIHQTEVTSTVSPENAGIGRPWNRNGSRAGENQSRMFSGRWGNALNSWAGVTGFVAVR